MRYQTLDLAGSLQQARAIDDSPAASGLPTVSIRPARDDRKISSQTVRVDLIYAT